MSGPKAPQLFSLCFPKGVFYFNLSILKILKIVWRMQSWVKTPEEILTPDLTSGLDFGLWEFELMGKSFF